MSAENPIYPVSPTPINPTPEKPSSNPPIINVSAVERHNLPLSALTPFQGKLKKRSEAQLNNLRQSIRAHGFKIPFFAWRDGKTNWSMDGHGRRGVLLDLTARGEIPQNQKFPVVFIAAKDEKEARELLLQNESRYGDITKAGLDAFVSDLPEINLDDYDLDISGLYAAANEMAEKVAEYDANGPADEKPDKLPLMVAVTESQYEAFQSAMKRYGCKRESDLMTLLIARIDAEAANDPVEPL
jgi:hypothetical protein